MELTKEQNEILKELDQKNSVDTIMKIIGIPSNKFRITDVHMKSIVVAEKVAFPKSGGILTYYDGMKYPAKGFPVNEIVEKIDDVKRFIVIFPKAFKDVFKGSRIKTLLLLLIFKKQYMTMLRTLLLSLARHLQMYRINHRFFCTTVRSVRNAFMVLMDKYREVDGEKYILIQTSMKLITQTLEFDDAYRYRFQHVIGHLDKQAFSKKPFKELDRLIDIAIKSEGASRVKESWKAVKLSLKFMRFLPYRKDLILFFNSLNIEEVKLSVGDMYHAKRKVEYDWNVEYECPED